MDHRIDRVERDIVDLNNALRVNTNDISTLKEGQAENRIFQKLIMEQLGEIKLLLNTHPVASSEWIGLVKWILSGTIIAIVVWMVKGAL